MKVIFFITLQFYFFDGARFHSGFSRVHHLVELVLLCPLFSAYETIRSFINETLR